MHLDRRAAASLLRPLVERDEGAHRLEVEPCIRIGKTKFFVGLGGDHCAGLVAPFYAATATIASVTGVSSCSWAWRS